MHLPCCDIYRTGSDPLFCDNLSLCLKSEFASYAICFFISQMNELINTRTDYCLYMFNARMICPCQTRTGVTKAAAHGRGPARIEALPAFSASSDTDDLAAAQIEIGMRLYGYDTVLVDMSRLKERARIDLSALSALCLRLGMALVQAPSIDGARGGPVSPAS